MGKNSSLDLKKSCAPAHNFAQNSQTNAPIVYDKSLAIAGGTGRKTDRPTKR